MAPATSRGRRIAVLSGLGVLLLAVLASFHGRSFNCAWLRGWLVGRWESAPPRGRIVIWEIEAGGKVAKRVRFNHGIEIEVISADYRLEGDGLVPGLHSDRFADGRHRALPSGFDRFTHDGADEGGLARSRHRRLGSQTGPGKGKRP